MAREPDTQMQKKSFINKLFKALLSRYCQLCSLYNAPLIDAYLQTNQSKTLHIKSNA